MEETTLHLDKSVWKDAFIKGCDSKRLKLLFVQEYGLETETTDRLEMERTLRETNAQFLKHLSELAELVERLHDNPALKLSHARAQLKSITHIDIKAQTRANFNSKIINILSFTDNKKYHVCDAQRVQNDFFVHIYRILKFKSFSDSSKLENVKIKYHHSTKEQLVEKYKKLGKLQNESI